MLENQEIINKENISTKYGIIGGITLSITFLLLQLAVQESNTIIRFLPYLVLGIVLIIGLKKYKEQMKGQKIFIKGIGFGAKISFLASIVFVVFNIILFLLIGNQSINIYGIPYDSGENLALISGILFFECFVIGSLISFIALQGFKEDVTY